MTQQLSLCHTEGPSDALNYAIIGSDNGLSPDRRQAIIWTNAGLDTYFFLNLAVGQPKNNMDLPEIEIYLGMMIIFFPFRKKKSGRTVYLYT